MAITLSSHEIPSLIPERCPDSNKGSYGKLLIIAGSEGMSGAAFLSALAAYRAGTGLVKIFSHNDNRLILQTLLPEAIFCSYSSEDDIRLKIEEQLLWAGNLIVGPGLGTSVVSYTILKSLLHFLQNEQNTKKRVVLFDADALNLLATHDDLMNPFDDVASRADKNIIITPHPMEMERLLHHKKTVTEIVKSPMETALQFSKQHHVITVMKGSHTAVSSEDGEHRFLNPTACPALAKGGSGDVLTGCIMGIHALLHASPSSNVDFPPAFLAAALGVAVHVDAGILAAKKYGTHGVLARDVANEIGRLLDLYREKLDGDA